MKNNNIKSRSTICVFLLGLCMLLISAAFMITPDKSYAIAENSNSSISMVDGASIRKVTDSSGIRFSTKISDAVVLENYEFGTIISTIPVEGELTLETPKAKYTLAQDVLTDGNGGRYYNVALIKIPDTEYATKITARSFMKNKETQEITYTNTVVRSVGYVASVALIEGEEDPDGVIADYVDKIATQEEVAFSTQSIKLNKDTITNESLNHVTVGSGNYAVKLESNNPDVVKIENGKIIPQIKEGKATITATLGKETSSMEVKVVSYAATIGDKIINDNTTVKVDVSDDYFASVNTPTVASIANEKLVVTEFDGTNKIPVTDYIISDSEVVNIDKNTGEIKGGTKNKIDTIKISINGFKEIFKVQGITKITTKEQMDELSLVTWRERNNSAKAIEVLSAYYVLGNDINYNGEYILPIANGSHSRQWSDGKGGKIALETNWGYVSYCSWVWKDILERIEPNAPELANWGEAICKFSDGQTGINPERLVFNGTFDGNGHSIIEPQLLDVNFLISNQHDSNNYYTSAGGCFIGEIGEKGVLKNVNFQGLRFRKYHGNTSAERETVLDPNIHTDKFLYVGTKNCKIPYRDSITKGSQSALVMFNRGLISDVRMYAYYKSAEAIWSNNNLDSNNKNDAFLSVINLPTGIINNCIVEHHGWKMEYLRHSDAYVNGKDGELVKDYVEFQSCINSGNKNIFYARNYGTVQNTFYLNERASGSSPIKDLNKNSAYHDKVQWTCCSDEKPGANAGTVRNVRIVDSNSANSSWDYIWDDDLAKMINNKTILIDSFDTNLWNTTTMKLKVQE